MPVETPRIETPRLVLRPLELSDADALQRRFPRWEIVAFLAAVVPWPYPDDGALAFVRDVALPAIREGRQWHWSIRPKPEPDMLIGMIALSDQQDNNRGYWLDPAWQARGLMREASEAVTDFWFETLDRPVLRVHKAVGNERSRRISIASGMRVVATFEKDYVAGRLPAELWEITREDWRRRRDSRPRDPGRARPMDRPVPNEG